MRFSQCVWFGVDKASEGILRTMMRYSWGGLCFKNVYGALHINIIILL